MSIVIQVKEAVFSELFVMHKKLLLTGLSVCSGIVFLWSCQKTQEQPVALAAGQQMRTVSIARGDLSAMVSASGKIEPISRVEVKSKASGQIIAMPVEEGDRVERGSLIARIDETETRNAYEQAAADLEVAKATVSQTASNIKRQEEMFNRGLISQAEIDQVRLEEVRARAQLVKAQTELSTMETRLKDCTVRSPIVGIVLQKNVEDGQIISSGINSVSGGTLIATVAKMDSVYVYAQVDEVDVGQVQIGQAASVVPDAFPDNVFHGTVLRIAPLAQVEQNVTTFNVTVIVPNPNRQLKAGMNTTVDITVADKRDVLLVPKEALKDMRDIRAQMQAVNAADSSAEKPPRGAAPDSMHAQRRVRMAGGTGAPGRAFAGGGNGTSADGLVTRRFVLVKTEEGYRPRPVETGLSNFDYAEVLSGLQEGETVAIFSNSRAGAAREALMNRMRNASGFSGFGGQQQQRPSSGR
jgi:HlyD family secretion protein